MRGHLMMSQKEREYLKVLTRVSKKELKLSDASRMLRLSYRHTQRIYKRYREQGDQGLVHRSRGRTSNRAYVDEFRTTIIARYKARYDGFGPTLGSEKHRSWRERKARFGEMLQMDGSHHAWFEDRADPCCLMNAADDATTETMSLLDDQETIYAAMTLLWNWIERFGIPGSINVDRKNIFASPDK